MEKRRCNKKKAEVKNKTKGTPKRIEKVEEIKEKNTNEEDLG